MPVADDSVAASLAWSKAGSRVRVTGSTRMNSVPAAVVLRYQSRSSGSQFGATLPPTTSDERFAARNFSARA